MFEELILEFDAPEIVELNGNGGSDNAPCIPGDGGNQPCIPGTN